MILASGVLLLTAIGLLIAGWLANLELAYIYGSIGATVLAGVFLLLGVRSRRGRPDAVGPQGGEVPSHVTPVDALLVAGNGAPGSALDGAEEESLPAQGSVRLKPGSGPGADADDAVAAKLGPAELTMGTATMPTIPAPARSYDDVSADQTGDAPAGAAGSGSGEEADGAASTAVNGPHVTGPHVTGTADVTGPDRTGPVDAIAPDVISPDVVGPDVVGPVGTDPHVIAEDGHQLTGPDVGGQGVDGTDLAGPALTGTAFTARKLPGSESAAETVGRTPAPRKVTSRKVASTTSRSPQPLSPAESVLVIPDRDRYHREACRFVRTPSLATTMPRSDAAGRGYLPCGVCKP